MEGSTETFGERGGCCPVLGKYASCFQWYIDEGDVLHCLCYSSCHYYNERSEEEEGRIAPPAYLGLTTFDKSPTPIGKNVRELAPLDVSIEAMSDWVDKETMKVNAGKKKRRSHKAA